MRPSLNHCSYKTFLNQGLRVKETKGNARKCQAITIRLNESTLGAKHLSSPSDAILLINNVDTFLVKTSTVCWPECIQGVWVWGSCLSHKEGGKEQNPATEVYETNSFSKSATHRHKTHYWSTKLEVTKLIWVLKKTHHLIEAAEQSTIIYIDHTAAVEIEHQFSLNTTAVKKLNLRLVRASEYLQRFRLKIQYKSGKPTLYQTPCSDYSAATMFTNG
jgi:hypothetical protein